MKFKHVFSYCLISLTTKIFGSLFLICRNFHQIHYNVLITHCGVCIWKYLKNVYLEENLSQNVEKVPSDHNLSDTNKIFIQHKTNSGNSGRDECLGAATDLVCIVLWNIYYVWNSTMKVDKRLDRWILIFICGELLKWKNYLWNRMSF